MERRVIVRTTNRRYQEKAGTSSDNSSLDFSSTSNSSIPFDSSTKSAKRTATDDLAQNYEKYVRFDKDFFLIPNFTVFVCVICLGDVKVSEGVVLRECLHEFCKNCLASTIEHSEEAVISCPYGDKCSSTLQVTFPLSNTF